MIPTDFLFHLAEYEQIQIEWANLTNIKGLYLSTPALKTPVIALAHSLHSNERELRCVLSHELGHHFETTGHYIIAANNLTSIYATKNEKVATKWAVELMIDTYAFFNCVKSGMDKQDLADHFFVSPKFIEIKGKYLRRSKKHCEVMAELKTCSGVCF